MITSATQHDWEIQIKKYLKDKPLSDFIYEVVPGINYQPFASASNTEEKQHSLIAGQSCLIGVHFPAPANNKSILTALENGVESIEIDVNDNTELSRLLKDVRLDYITPVFNVSSDNAANKLAEHLNDNYSVGQLPRLITNGDNIKSNTVKEHLTTMRSNDNDPIGELVDLCEKLKKGSTANTAIYLNISEGFFLEIARIRAIKILVANLSRDMGRDLKYTIVARLRPSVIVDDDDNNLIHQTCAALSAIIGGADILQLNPWDEKKPNYARLSIHIQNILALESNIHRFNDVMGGSYFMEDLTDKIASAVWEKLN